MPLIDMPLSQLQEYHGINPCPDDYDIYWSRALAEMHAVDYQVQRTPAPFSCSYADCFDMYFTGTKGARLYAQFLRPKKLDSPAPTVLMFHGYAGDSGAFSDKLAYVAAGYCVAALDVRGQGGKSQDIGGIVGNTLRGHITRGIDDQPDNLFYRDVFLDTALLAKVVMSLPEVDSNRLCATGVSQGGALTLVCSALVPTVKRLAPVFPFLCDYQRVWEMDLCKDAYEDILLYFRRFDPQHKRREEIFRKLGYIDVQFLAPRIHGEVLFFTGLADTICPPSTQFAAYNKITTHKEMEIYPDFAHENMPGRADQIFSFLTRPW